MELKVRGWSRNHGEKVIASRDLTEARSAFGNPEPHEVYVTTVEGRESGPFGVKVIENGSVELSFYASISLNGEFLVKQTMSRKEIAKLLLLSYNDCSFGELLDVIYELRHATRRPNLAPVMLKDVRELGLSESATVWLVQNDIWRVGDLVQKTEAQMRGLPGFDDHAFFEIWHRLTPLGLRFGMNIPNLPAAPTTLKSYLKEIGELKFSVRTANCLRNDYIIYVGDLVQKTEAEMLRTPNLGRKGLNEIKEALGSMGLHLGTEIPGWPLVKKLYGLRE